jgi:hypothetical protein
MAQNWWEAAPVVAPANDPAFTGFIPGQRKPEDPLDAEAKRLEIARKRQILAKGGEGGMGEGEAKLREGESQAAFLSTNLAGNIAIMNKALKADPSVARPTWGQVFSGYLGSDVKNALLPEQRQVVEDSQRIITDAALTLGTGAAYTPEQIEAYRRGFFPQVGDKPAQIEAKRERLKLALAAARIKAGNAAPKIDEAMAALGLNDGVIPTGTTTYAPEGEGPKGDRATPEQEQALLAFVRAHPGDPNAINAFAKANGFPYGVNAEELAGAKSLAGGINYSKVDEAAEAKARELIARQDKTGIGGDSAQERLIKSGATLGLSDEASGIGNAASSLLHGKNPIEGYVTGRDAERLRIADARKQLGYGGTALEIAGGFMSANPTSALAPFVSRANTIRQGAKAGAYGGAVGGYGMGEGFEGSVSNAVVGAAAGAALGSGISALGTRPARAMDLDLARAADAEGVGLIRPMVDPASRGAAGAAESRPLTQPIIRGGVQRVEDAIEGRAGDLGAGGTVMDPDVAGEVVQRSAQRFITNSRGVADRLYNRARTLAGDAPVIPRAALGQLRQEMMQLRAAPNTNQGEIAFLEGLGEDLTSGPMTVDAIRGLRQSIRGRINEQNLTATQAEARAVRVLDAVQQDVASSLPREAATAFRRADSYYRERMVHIDDVLDRFLGGNVQRGQPRLSGEKAFQRLKSMASPGGDGRRLAAMMRNLEPQERLDISATIAQSLGRDAPDGPFALGRFLQHTKQLSPSARRTIFGPAGSESIENLRLLSRSLIDAQSDTNWSRSGTTVIRAMGGQAKALVAGLLGVGGTAIGGTAAAGFGAIAAGATAAGVAGGVRALSARALMSPRVTRWLYSAANVNTPRQAQIAVQRLGTVIAREPALASELQPLQRALNDRLSLSSAAASEKPDSGEDND